jgi:hypothetical protein
VAVNAVGQRQWGADDVDIVVHVQHDKGSLMLIISLRWGGCVFSK